MAGGDFKRRFARRKRFRNRELSWLDFNNRVMEEARDPDVPVLERLKFLAIFSSNLDEFFTVRVALVRRQIEAGLDRPGADGLRPSEVMRYIVRRVREAHEGIGNCFRNVILPALSQEGIVLLSDAELSGEPAEFARKYFRTTVAPLLKPLLTETDPFPHLESGGLYFCIEFSRSGRARTPPAFLRLPTNSLGRFVRFPGPDGVMNIVLIDDIIRFNLTEIFPERPIAGCYEIRIVRDSDLDLDEVGSTDLLRSILEGLQRRQSGPTTRLLHDPAMPPRLTGYLQRQLNLKKIHRFVGARNHSFADFMQVPAIVDRPDLLYPPMPPLPVRRLERAPSLLKEMQSGDILLQHPYQSFNPVIRFFEESAEDPHVTEIAVTLYRVSSDSAIAKALVRAAETGKRVRVVVELKARFDEERNIGWARALQTAGAQVVYGGKNLKTHCKVAMVVREEEGGERRYCHLSTGNYNDRTARIYSDIGLLTTHEGICADVATLFGRIMEGMRGGEYGYLLVAPDEMRKGFVKRIHREIRNAQKGGQSGIVAKMNSLVDPGMIDELYAASRAGVPIRLIVRGICCLRPGVRGLSETIEVRSIIDRFLEHTRLYRFENAGSPELFLASADWMPRNLNGRVEAAFPILDKGIRKEIDHAIGYQLGDTNRARILTPEGHAIRASGPGGMRAQMLQYQTLSDAG